MYPNHRRSRGKAGVFFLVALGSAGVTAAVVAVQLNIHTRKIQALTPVFRLTEVDEDTVDPQEWGKNFPRQLDGYLRTSTPTRTKYGGGAGAEGDVPPQKASKDPWLTRMFAGYLFAVDYRDRRGHAFMLVDQETTRRNVPGKQSGNCLHCHASVMPLYRLLGREGVPGGTRAEQEKKGMETAAAMEYWDAHDRLKETVGACPVSCVDCHDPKTNELRVTRPAFIDAIKQYKAHLGTSDFEPNRDATRQEMRSYVCAQCHVEYFCGKGAALFYPWANGLRVEEIESHYDAMIINGKRFKDWVHAETGAEVLKAQHPEFEVWSQGIQARSGVACADCHMPYKREGAMKISEHWVRSPLLMINLSCQTCHHFPEEELREQVEAIQDRHYALLRRAGQALVDMLDAFAAIRAPYDERNRAQAEAEAEEHLAQDEGFASASAEEQEKRLQQEIGARLTAMWSEIGSSKPDLKEIAELQRKAQWRLDFAAAENSMGFHAPQELARILAESIDYARQAEQKARLLKSTRDRLAAGDGQKVPHGAQRHRDTLARP